MLSREEKTDMVKIIAGETAEMWYPMRIAYQQSARVRAGLEAMGIRYFFPMEWRWVMHADGQKHYEHLPVFASMIFIHASYARLCQLKSTEWAFMPLRFYTRSCTDDAAEREIFPIPEKQMKDFMRLSMSNDERVVFLKETDYLKVISQRVRIIEGEFAGVEGVVKRIKNNRCVVVRLDGLASVALLRCPITSLIKI